ncbi:tyrosine-protein phosphatase [Flavimarina sp. Hel_I_48]|uniref:tyrosine-protein phosphatase n=1 Tax=Flavimarina sp. Hel_I_48 TaxID=1392488 RepID=UPI0004DF0471|nr:CpsB/CapC family capsule biosynthesis tyrosine phosphatase [Flavimarina sp. Hel_I_48]
MLSILKSKNYLVNLFDGYTDIHNHILPGIDDGAQNLEESVALVSQLNEIGISNFICTPHTMGDYYPNTPETINNAADTLRTSLMAKGNTSLIQTSSEYMLDEGFSTHLKDGDLMPFTSDKHILIEISYLQPPINLEELLFDLTHAGYIPILAHPERYSYYHKRPEYYAELQRLGCLLQLNALSLSDYYGSSVKKMALELLENGQYTFLGTDVHSFRHITQLKKIIFKKKYKKLLQQVIYQTTDSFAL